VNEIYILDGYNVIGKIPRLRDIKLSRGLDAARKALAMMLSDINHNRPRIKFKIIFDGKTGEVLNYSKADLHGIECFFTKSGEEADDYIGIILMNRKDNAGVVVISGDNKVRNKCKVYGASIQEPLELQKLVGNQSKITQSTKTDDKNIKQQDGGDITRWYTKQLKKRDAIL
jgi:predicted RNA-binding protein with PIN domain